MASRRSGVNDVVAVERRRDGRYVASYGEVGIVIISPTHDRIRMLLSSPSGTLWRPTTPCALTTTTSTKTTEEGNRRRDVSR